MGVRRLGIFAHHHPEGRFLPEDLALIDGLRSELDGLEVLSASPDLEASSREALRGRGLVARIVPNAGYDFRMWRDGLSGLDLARFEELVLFNSSIVGPLFPLEEAFEIMDEASVDVWAMTDNHEIRWHLQTYFLVFRRAAFEALHLFMQGVLPYKDKMQVILSYELGLSVHLLESGLNLGAYRPTQVVCPEIAPHARPNPVIHRPVELLRTRMPFVKREVLRDNPGRADLEEVRRLMRAGSEAPTSRTLGAAEGKA